MIKIADLSDEIYLRINVQKKIHSVSQVIVRAVNTKQHLQHLATFRFVIDHAAGGLYFVAQIDGNPAPPEAIENVIKTVSLELNEPVYKNGSPDPQYADLIK
jgi:hypothetical protein